MGNICSQSVWISQWTVGGYQVYGKNKTIKQQKQIIVGISNNSELNFSWACKKLITTLNNKNQNDFQRSGGNLQGLGRKSLEKPIKIITKNKKEILKKQQKIWICAKRKPWK